MSLADKLSDVRQPRSRLGLCLALVLLWTGLYQAESADAARVPTKGRGQDVAVLCVQFNGLPTHRTCQEWVQELNAKVTPWFEENSHGVTSFDFRLPTIHGGQSLPQDGWFPVTITGNNGVFVSNIGDEVLPAVDPIVDFSNTDRLLIIGNSDTFFGQATGGFGPQQQVLSHRAFPVAEHGMEERWVLEDGTEQWRRRMAVAMIWEGRFFDPSKTDPMVDPVTGLIESEAVTIHELSHWLGLPDRYGGYASVPAPRRIADLYSLMGLTRWWKANPHWIGEARSDLGFNYDRRIPLTLGVGTSRLIHLIPGYKPTPYANEHYLARIPLQASGPFQGYGIEARQNNYRSWPSRQSLLEDRTTEEGVLITWINEGVSSDYEITIVQDTDDTNPAHAPFEVGDVYEDPGQGVRIEVVGEEYEGYLVQVDVVAPGDMRPDPAITLWDTTRWESVDIWVDNQINGYGTLEFTNPDGTADGNGDRPEPEVENRVYFRVRNHGLAEAKNVTVDVYAAFPGAGDASSRWNLLGRAYLPSVPSQGFVESFVNWTPPADHGGHACLKVEIAALPNELDTSNNLAQENVFEFESTRNSPWKAQHQSLFIHNPFDDRELLIAMDVQNLPTEWAVTLYPETFTLPADGSQEVFFELLPSGFPGQPSTNSYEEGQIFNVGVVAHAWTPDQDHIVLGGVSAMTQLKHRVTVDLELVDPGKTSATLGGCLSWSIPGATIAMRITDPKGNVTIDHATSDSSGCFTYNLQGYSGVWEVTAIYDGVGIYSSARSEPLVVKMP